MPLVNLTLFGNRNISRNFKRNKTESSVRKSLN